MNEDSMMKVRTALIDYIEGSNHQDLMNAVQMLDTAIIDKLQKQVQVLRLEMVRAADYLLHTVVSENGVVTYKSVEHVAKQLKEEARK